MLPATMTRDEILAEVLDRPRNAFTQLADTEVIARPGWRQLVTPSMKRGGYNDVSYVQLTDAEADAVIDATIAQFRSHDCKFVWRVGPGNTPADLGARLAARGGVHNRACGMARATSPIDATPASAGITVEPVDAHTVDLFTDTMATGWGIDAAPLYAMNRTIIERASARLGPPTDDAPHQYLFLARVDGEAAATAGAVVFARSTYFVGGVTAERFRGRGLYRALVEVRLALARSLGIPLAMTHARSDTSAPILERLGFETICDFDNYSFDP